MKYVGVDLHKHTITICVVDASRKALKRVRLSNQQTEQIVQFLSELGEFEITVEATASYEWFVQLVEPLARRVVLAHPGKLRIIAESTRKSDKLDARVLAEMLAQNLILPAYRPTPRQRAHRRLVRHRAYLQRRITGVRNKVRHILADYNLDRKDLFTECGQEYLAALSLEAEDRFVVDQLTREWLDYGRQRHESEKRLRAFAAQGSAQEQADRRRLYTIPGVGDVTVEVLLAELAGPQRFTSAKQVVSYAGLAPGQRESAGKRKNLSIEKTGSPLLRWVLVQAAWQLVQRSRKWGLIHAALESRVGRKKAIIAVARRLLCVAHTLLRKGEDYREIRVTRRQPAARRAAVKQRRPRRPTQETIM
jgi:transposase